MMKNPASAMKLPVLLISLGMLGGCGNQYFRVDPVLHHQRQAGSDGSDKQAQKAPIDLDSGKYKALYEAAREGEQISRNQLQNKIIELSDDVCEKHKGDVIGSAAEINLLTGVGATVFSSVAAIVTGAAATNYATGATILNGTKTAVSAEVYQGLFATAIIKAIDESRGKKKNEILAKQLEGAEKYSVDTAVVDAQDYHFRCSFYHGLVVLTEDSKKRATPSREETLGKIKILRDEMAENNKQKSLVGEEAIGSDATNKKIQQGIDALYDRLNLTE